MLSDAKRRASGLAYGSQSSPELSQRVDASKFLAKPCGRPEVKPEVDIMRGGGIGGVTGVFGGDGAKRMALNATGGPDRLLTKAVAHAARDKRLKHSWHEGLTPAELKAGQQNAARRGALAAKDKAECP